MKLHQLYKFYVKETGSGLGSRSGLIIPDPAATRSGSITMDTSDIRMSHLKELGVLTVVQAEQVLLHLKKEPESWKKYPYGLVSFFKF